MRTDRSHDLVVADLDKGNPMPVTKSELVEKLSESLAVPRARAEQVVNVMFDAMVATLERGEGIEIRGFGSFEVRSYQAYEGRNPRTGEPVHVKAKRLPFFKVGKELRERINASTGKLEVEEGDAEVEGDEHPDADDES